MKYRKRDIVLKILLVVFIVWALVALYNTNKPLPEGTSITGEIYEISGEDIDFLYDLTYINNEGEKVTEQEIFTEVFRMVDEAEKIHID